MHSCAIIIDKNRKKLICEYTIFTFDLNIAEIELDMSELEIKTIKFARSTEKTLYRNLPSKNSKAKISQYAMYIAPSQLSKISK